MFSRKRKNLDVEMLRVPKAKLAKEIDVAICNHSDGFCNKNKKLYFMAEPSCIDLATATQQPLNRSHGAMIVGWPGYCDEGFYRIPGPLKLHLFRLVRKRFVSFSIHCYMWNRWSNVVLPLHEWFGGDVAALVLDYTVGYVEGSTDHVWFPCRHPYPCKEGLQA